LVDDIPPNTSFVTCTPLTPLTPPPPPPPLVPCIYDPVADTITWTLPPPGDLLPLTTYTATYIVDVNDDIITDLDLSETITNDDATVTYIERGIQQNLTAIPITTNIGTIAIRKYVRNFTNPAVSPNAYQGDTLTYFIDYALISKTHNALLPTGDPTSPNISFIIDEIPDGVTYANNVVVSPTDPGPNGEDIWWSTDDGATWQTSEPTTLSAVTTITWQHPTGSWIAPDTTVYQIYYDVTVDSATTGTISNDALVNYNVSDIVIIGGDSYSNPFDTEYSNRVWSNVLSGIPAQDFDPTSACVAMDLSKSSPSAASLGEPILYTINYSNSGSGPYADAYNVVITDRIPDGTSISGVPPATHPNTGLPIMPVTYDTDGDGADDTILWDIGYLADGTSGTLRFSIVVEALEDIKINQYFIRVYEYPKFEQINDLPSKVLMGGIGSGKPLIDYSIVPTDVFKETNDAEFIQVHRDGSKIETTVLRIFEKLIFWDEFIAEYVHFADDTKISDYLFWKKVLADISIDITYENLCCETEELTELYAGDEFLIYALIQNKGTGTAYDFTYKIDSPNLSPEDITWIYDKDIEPAENLMMAPPLQVLGSNNINPYLLRDYQPILFPDGEIAFLTFLAKAPSVTHETTIPITVRVWYLNEYGEQHEAFKTIFLNVKAQRRGDLEILRRITGTEVMGQRFPENNNIFFPPEGTEYSPKRTDTVSMRVGDERMVSIFLRNPSDYELFNVHYIDVIPPGLEISSGSAEWWGTLKPSEVVRVTYKLRAKQVGTYQFKGKATYKDLRNQPYLVTSSLFQIVVKENDGIEILKDLDLDGGYNKTDKIYNIEKGGELVVVIKVKNNSDTAVGNLDVIELVPPGFEVKELFTEGLLEENGVLKYHISKLEASKYILIKYSLKASQQAGTYTLKATRLVYPHEGVKEEILSRHILPTEEGKPEERVTDIVIQVTETLIPNLSPSIDAEREVVASGENITLILKLQNTGGITAKNLKLTLPVPKGTKFLDASIQPVKENENLIFTIDEIPSGETYVLKPTFLSPNFSQDKTLLFTFSGMYTDDYKREYEIESELSLTIRAVKPRIDMVKRLSRNEVKIGYTVTFEISATNNGDTPAIVSLEDPIPQGFEIISGTNTWSGELLQGESVEIVYQVMCKKVGEFGLDPAKASYEDKWKTSYTSYSVKEFEDQYKLTVKGVLVSKTIDSEEVEVEDIIVVRVHIKNIYDEKAKKISVKDSIPDGLILVEGETSWYIEELGPSESVNFTYTLKTERGGTFTLPAILASFEDVYGDEYQSESDEVTLLVKEPVKPPEEVEEKPLEEEIVEEITPIYRFIRGYLLIFLLMVLAIVTFAVVILYLERRRREEEFEEYGVEELPYVRKPPEEEKSMRDRVRELLGGEEEEEGLPKRPVAEERIPPEEIKGIPKEEVSLLEKLGVKKEREKPEEIFFEELPEAAEKPEEELSALERSMEEKKPPSLKEMLEKEREIKKDYIPTPQELIKERKKKERKEEEKDNISELELLDERKVLRRKPEDEMDKKDLPDIRDILKGKKEEEEEP
ncbi:MAG: BatD family protein, partial [Candidatus Methanofastidiosia archaeon]